MTFLFAEPSRQYPPGLMGLFCQRRGYALGARPFISVAKVKEIPCELASLAANRALTYRLSFILYAMHPADLTSMVTYAHGGTLTLSFVVNKANRIAFDANV